VEVIGLLRAVIASLKLRFWCSESGFLIFILQLFDVFGRVLAEFFVENSH
jgi:hypothetical protein